ncbi:MAG TPA: pantoate--beta-alanine ligase [Caulobacteraceae bacterium]|nr:pantoate--beta-alanine ligase [Caulobacteraceae bacterium]
MTQATLPIARTVADLRGTLDAWGAAGQTIGMVPTMGALHDGHLSLIAHTRARADRVIASIFVNPTQFAPGEDFDAYPRGEARDAALLASAGCDLLFAPGAQEMYPPGFATTITVSGVSEPLDGRARPAHFSGVATVVAKLLIQARPDVAVFGEKDYQQLLVIKRLARDLDLPTQILGAPTVRAEDGLALSSRNAYLTPAEREIAASLNVVLLNLARALAEGAAVAPAEAEAVEALLAAGFESVDYIEARGADDLARLGPGPIGQAPARVLAAARLGQTRLIDNRPV